MEATYAMPKAIIRPLTETEAVADLEDSESWLVLFGGLVPVALQ